MNLEEKISRGMSESVRAGDRIRLETFRSIRAAIIEFNKSGAGRPMNEDDEIRILNNQAKRRREAIEMYTQGNRPDLAEKEKSELAVIEELLPQKLGEAEIRATIASIIAESGATSMKDMAKVMGPAMKQFAGRADGKTVQAIVREMLGA
jgi:uncharacterized protein YqeY